MLAIQHACRLRQRWQHQQLLRRYTVLCLTLPAAPAGNGSTRCTLCTNR